MLTHSPPPTLAPMQPRLPTSTAHPRNQDTRSHLGSAEGQPRQRARGGSSPQHLPRGQALQRVPFRNPAALPAQGVPHNRPFLPLSVNAWSPRSWIRLKSSPPSKLKKSHSYIWGTQHPTTTLHHPLSPPNSSIHILSFGAHLASPQKVRGLAGSMEAGPGPAPARLLTTPSRSAGTSAPHTGSHRRPRSARCVGTGRPASAAPPRAGPWGSPEASTSETAS